MTSKLKENILLTSILYTAARNGPEVTSEPPEVRSVGIKFHEGAVQEDESFRPRKSTTYCKEMESCDQNQ